MLTGSSYKYYEPKGSYDDGYEDGWNDGDDEGWAVGHEAGYEEGFEDGLKELNDPNMEEVFFRVMREAWKNWRNLGYSESRAWEIALKGEGIL